MNEQNISATVEKAIKTMAGPLKDFKANHFNLFKNKGIKEVSQDSYKFSKFATFLDELKLDDSSSELNPGDYATSFPTITFKDGIFQAADSLPEGVTLKRIADEFLEIQNLIKDENALSHLHHSLLHDGVVIEVEKKKEILKPLRILHLVTKSSLSAPTHFVVANPFSKLTVIEETRSIEAAHAVVGETYILAHESSIVEHICLDEEGQRGVNHSSVYAEIAKDASVKSFIFHGNGKVNRKNLTLNLNAPGSNGESYCLYLSNNEEHSDIYTNINHKAPDTTSNQIAKGILDGNSKGIFTGKIHIFPKSQRVSSGQLNKNLLLSKKAQVHSQPQLEIFADDVKCSHGSTTGQLSQDEIFYFQARGIPEDRARNLLAMGFGLEIVQKIENKEAQNHVSEIIMENLASKFSLERSK